MNAKQIGEIASRLHDWLAEQGAFDAPTRLTILTEVLCAEIFATGDETSVGVPGVAARIAASIVEHPLLKTNTAGADHMMDRLANLPEDKLEEVIRRMPASMAGRVREGLAARKRS